MAQTIWQLDPANLTPYYNIALCDALASAGQQVRYVTSRFLYDTELPIAESFQTDYVYFKGLNNPVLLNYTRIRRIMRAFSYPLGHWRVLQEARRQRPDVVHFQWSRLPRLDYELIRRLQAVGIPVVHTVHDVLPLYAMNSRTDYLQRIYETADALIVHTQANIPDLLEVYPAIDRQRIHVIPHLEIANHGVPPEANKTRARAALGLPQDAPVFLFFGNIRYYKGVDILVDAFGQVIKQNDSVHLLIAGRADPLELQKLPEFHHLDAYPNTHLHQGFIPHRDVWKYYLAADVVVYPYRHIYQSGALITAMGFGRAVIATEVGGLPETIDGNGWLVPPEDSTALAAVMLEAATDGGRLEAMGRRSRDIIDTVHAGHIVAEQLLAVYDRLANQQTANAADAPHQPG